MIHKNKCFKSLFLSIVSFCFMQAQQIDKKALCVPQRLGNISLCHDNNGFTVITNSQSIPIQPCFLDKELRGISKRKLSQIIAAGGYLSINKINEENQYSLKLNGRLLGGGVVGANVGFWIGRLGTSFLGHGAILVAGALTGPAAPATILALEGSFGFYIESTANAAGLAGGILGAVITGPV